jgi:hypothetical protein
MFNERNIQRIVTVLSYRMGLVPLVKANKKLVVRAYNIKQSDPFRYYGMVNTETNQSIFGHVGQSMLDYSPIITITMINATPHSGLRASAFIKRYKPHKVIKLKGTDINHYLKNLRW